MTRIGYKQLYTHKNYSRGSMRRRDFIVEELNSPKCQICKLPIRRKLYESGNIQSVNRWLKMKTCGKEWDKKKNKYVATSCLKKWMSISENNPNYKGIKDIPCMYCGKTGLTYKNKGSEYKFCRKCFDKNRPESVRKIDDSILLRKCHSCKKDFSLRLNCGKIRYPKNKNKVFCSSACANKR